MYPASTLYTDRGFHFEESLAHGLTTHKHKFPTLLLYFLQCPNSNTFFFFARMATMKENKGKGLADEEITQEEEVHSQPCLAAGEKRKTLSKTIDMRSLPSRRGHKKAKHGFSKFGVVKAGSVILPAPTKQPSMQILDIDLSNPPKGTPSKNPFGSPMTLIRSEGLALERLQ